MLWRVLILLMTMEFSLSLAPNDVLILILSQPDEYHSQLAYNLRLDILNQSLLISKDNLVNVHLTHEILNHIGDWTILYIIPSLMKTNLIHENIKWIIFCEDQSIVNLNNLLKGLSNVDYSKEIYLGHPLHDQEATIIHHFAFFEYPKWFPYPLLRSGVAFSKPLINTLETLLAEKTKLPRTEFFIDASHELSFFIWQNIKIEKNKSKILSSATIEKSQLINSKKTQVKNKVSIVDDHHYVSDKKEIFTKQLYLKYNSSTTKKNNNINNTNSSSKIGIQHFTTVIDVDNKNSKRNYSANKYKNISSENNKQTDVENNKKNNKTDIRIVYHNEIHDNGSRSNRNQNKTSNTVSSKSNNNNNNTKQKFKTTKDLDNIVKKKLLLVNASSYFCSNKGKNCAIYPNIISGNNTLCSPPINPKTIYFAIKTCQKFHKERIPLIEATWGQYTPIKRYFSDVKDNYIPTIATGIPNTDSGHCAKALQILRKAVNEIDVMNKNSKIKIKWVVLSDDDTLLSVSSICDILGCFNPKHFIYLGERYGYRLHAKDGFNYITGGGAIAFSIPTVIKIIKFCTCPQDSSPDDMIIGICLKSLGIIPIHSSRFHQARPCDYPLEGVKIEKPVSFHKLEQIDPVNVYKKFLFGDMDQKLFNSYAEYALINSNNTPNTLKYNISGSKNCDQQNLDDNHISVKLKKAHQKLKVENIEHRRKLQAFSKSTTTLFPKSKLFQHIDL